MFMGDTILSSFQFAMGSQNSIGSAFSSMNLKRDEQEKKGSLITAVTVDKGTNKEI